MLTSLVISSANAAVTWKQLQFGGFFSQGYLKSTDNDYLGETEDGTFDLREYALNVSWSHGKWRVGAQVFGQKVGEYGDDEIKLDWAGVDYQATQWFGMRAGRIKLPRGLYNEALDVDSVRPFVLLPQSVYDARLRDFSAAFNGGMVYGNIDLKKAGSLDYKAFYGEIPMDVDSGANDYFSQDIPFTNTDIDMEDAYGGTLFWNTPIIGLRAGYSFSNFRDFGSIRLVVVNPPLPFYRRADNYRRHLFSAEYLTGDWIFATEFGFEECIYDVGAQGGPATLFLDYESHYGYISAARRINSWLELGAYYSYSKEEQVTINNPAITVPVLVQRDYALSAKFDITDYLLFKLEYHYMDDAGKIFNTPENPQPVDVRDNSWSMIAAKVTVYF